MPRRKCRAPPKIPRRPEGLTAWQAVDGSAATASGIPDRLRNGEAGCACATQSEDDACPPVLRRVRAAPAHEFANFEVDTGNGNLIGRTKAPGNCGHCGRAMNPGSRVLIIEMVRRRSLRGVGSAALDEARAVPTIGLDRRKCGGVGRGRRFSPPCDPARTRKSWARSPVRLSR